MTSFPRFRKLLMVAIIFVTACAHASTPVTVKMPEFRQILVGVDEPNRNFDGLWIYLPTNIVKGQGRYSVDGCPQWVEVPDESMPDLSAHALKSDAGEYTCKLVGKSEDVVEVTPITFLVGQNQCGASVYYAIEDMESNPAFHKDLFLESAFNSFVYADNISPETKAGILNGRSYLTNRELDHAVFMAESCGIPTPLLDGSKDQLWQAYGPFYLLGKNDDLYVGGVLGGTPELDYEVTPTLIQDGESVFIFGTTFTFKYVEDRPADVITPIDIMVYSVESELGHIWAGTLEGKFVFAMEGEVVVVQVKR